VIVPAVSNVQTPVANVAAGVHAAALNIACAAISNSYIG